MRACRAGFPLTVTVPDVGWIRSPITRSSVDLPQPDGPISETNSPGRRSRSMSCSAVTLPLRNVFVRPAIETTGAALAACGSAFIGQPSVARSCDVLRRSVDDDLLGEHDREEEHDPE